MKCKYCGASLESYDLYCSLCGKPVVELSSSDDPLDFDFMTPDTSSQTVQNPVYKNADTSAGSQKPNAADASTHKSSPRQVAEAAARRQSELSSAYMDNYEKAVEKNAEKAAKIRSENRSRKSALLIITCLSLILAMLSTGYCAYTMLHTSSLRGQLKKANADNQAAESTITDLESSVTDLQSQVTSLKDENTSLGQQIADLNSQLDGLQTDVNQSTYDKETAENKLQDATDEVDALNTQITDLQTQLSDAQDENDSLKSDNEELTQENEENQEVLDFYDQHIVFVEYPSNDGYYHKYNCANYSKKSFIAYSTKLAEANGYTPCPVCCNDAASDTTGEADVQVSSTPTPSASASPSASPSPSSSTSFFSNLFR